MCVFHVDGWGQAEKDCEHMLDSDLAPQSGMRISTLVDEARAMLSVIPLATTIGRYLCLTFCQTCMSTAAVKLYVSLGSVSLTRGCISGERGGLVA